MPKLKSYDTDSFSFPIKGKAIKFANVKGQKTYIKNRMDRLLSKEPETIKWINQFEQDSVFFDIGANIGIYTLYSAIMMQNTVFAFEPHSASYKNLLDSINLNKLEKCQAYCVALSNLELSWAVLGCIDLYSVILSYIEFVLNCIELYLSALNFM